MKIARNLRTLRDQAGLTQAQLAEAARVGQSAISEVESGERRPRIDTVEKLAMALGCTVNDLLDDKQETCMKGGEQT